MARTPKAIRRNRYGYFPQMNDKYIKHLPRKRQKQIVLKAQQKRILY